MSSIFLVGMPGVGKTYWGRKLAAKYDYTFADLDEEIQQAAGKTIEGIFETEGEAYFRQQETRCLEQFFTKNKTIIACGGGTPVYNNNLELMKQNGCVVYIKADINTLTDRLGQDENTRPLLNGEHIQEKLERLYQERRTYYEQAHYTVQADETIIANFEQIIALCTERH
jgi:shikimate kinase